MKATLSKEEIKFIDTYLKNSDVRFADIRMEMVDHVASEVEARMEEGGDDFYETFKWYMAENKKSLLKQSRNYLLESEKKLFKQLVKNIYSWQGVLIILGSCFGVFLLTKFFDAGLLGYLPITVNLLAFFIYTHQIRKVKLRFSALEHIGVYLFILPQYVYIGFLPSGENTPITIGTLIWLMIGVLIPLLMLQLMTQTFKEFKTKYEPTV